MGDMAEEFNALKAHNRAKRASRLITATQHLNNCGVAHTWLTEYQVRFHVEGKPRVDLYPSSARGVFKYEGVNTKSRTMYGGIAQFLGWYKAQQAADDGVSCKRKAKKVCN